MRRLNIMQTAVCRLYLVEERTQTKRPKTVVIVDCQTARKETRNSSAAGGGSSPARSCLASTAGRYRTADAPIGAKKKPPHQLLFCVWFLLTLSESGLPPAGECVDLPRHGTTISFLYSLPRRGEHYTCSTTIPLPPKKKTGLPRIKTSDYL